MIEILGPNGAKARADKPLSVIMPAYNEGEKLYGNLFETLRTLEGIADDFELIVVNDGSTDDTGAVIEKAAGEDGRIRPVGYAQNMGKGHALRAGTEAARGDYVAFVDADMDLHPAQLANLFAVMQAEGADVVIGSKMHPDSIVDYPRRRRVISYAYYFLMVVLFRLDVRDTQTGMKLFRADIIKPVMRKILVKRFAFDIEVLVNCRLMGAKIAECPIELVFQRGSPWGRMRFGDVWHIALDTMAIFYRLYILRYYDDKKSPAEEEDRRP